MAKITTYDIEQASEDALVNALKIRARGALDQDNWILCATLCRAIDEIEINRAVAAGAQAARKALTERTVAVPLIRPPMLADTARLDLAGSTTPAGQPFATAPCGGCGATIVALEWHQEFVDVTRDPALPGLPFHERETIPGMIEFDGWRHQAPPTDPMQIIGHDASPAHPVTPTARGQMLIDTHG